MTPRYLAVEVLSGVLALALAERFVVHATEGAELAPSALEALLFFAFVGGLVIATFVDLEWMEIPDEVTIGGTALALATAELRTSVPLREIVLGAGGGFLLVQLLLVWSWERLTGERGMGEADSKLTMCIGAFLGWRGAIFALVAGSFQGIVAWAIARAAGARIGPSALADRAATSERAEAESASDGGGGSDGERDEAEEDEIEAVDPRKIPFGPFLALGAIEFLFFGDRIVDWYLNLFG